MKGDTAIATYDVGKFKALILEMHGDGMRFLCGYLAVPPGHPWNGQAYDAIDANVHGGLTFAGQPNWRVRPAPDGWWWVGFDCAHYLDAFLVESKMPGVRRDEAFVRSELASLAAQAADAKNDV